MPRFPRTTLFIALFAAVWLAVGGGALLAGFSFGMVGSIVARFAGASIAFYLAVRFREWKVVALGAMLFLMGFRQCLTLLLQREWIRPSGLTNTLSEVPGFLVSVLALISIVYVALMMVRDRRHIASLEGLLPICAACKKIRLEGTAPEEQKSWVAIERYISDHSRAQFTHGLCPHCAEQLYDEHDVA